MNTCHTLRTDYLIMISLWSGKWIYPPIIFCFFLYETMNVSVSLQWKSYTMKVAYILHYCTFSSGIMSPTQRDKYIMRGGEKKKMGGINVNYDLTSLSMGEREREKKSYFLSNKNKLLTPGEYWHNYCQHLFGREFSAYQIVACFAYSIFGYLFRKRYLRILFIGRRMVFRFMTVHNMIVSHQCSMTTVQ